MLHFIFTHKLKTLQQKEFRGLNRHQSLYFNIVSIYPSPFQYLLLGRIVGKPFLKLLIYHQVLLCVALIFSGGF